MNYSVQKERIIEYLKSVTSHPTAYEVYENIKKVIPNISLGTIYRNLDALEKNNQIIKIRCEMQDRYDGNANKHYHAKCEKCGKVIDIFEEYDYDLDKRINEKYKINVLSHDVMFHIICNNCKK